MKQLTDFLLLGLMAISGAAASTVAIWTWVPSPHAYMPVKIETHKAEVLGENNLVIHRSYCIKQAIPVQIARDLVRYDADNKVEMRYSLPMTDQIYEKGCHDIVRVFTLPAGILPGKYTLINTASWQANPLRRDSVVLPALTFEVK